MVFQFYFVHFSYLTVIETDWRAYFTLLFHNCNFTFYPKISSLRSNPPREQVKLISGAAWSVTGTQNLLFYLHLYFLMLVIQVMKLKLLREKKCHLLLDFL